MVDKKDTEKGKPKDLDISGMATFCKEKGFIFPNSELYGGFAGFFDYGPLGVELKQNLKNHWWHTFVRTREDVVGIDGTILSHPTVWKASGHVTCFEDKLLACSKCTTKVRADHFLEEKIGIHTEGIKAETINSLVKEKKLCCPSCGSPFKGVSSFNLMFKTHVGAVTDDASISYLRPETAQLIFTNFRLVMDSARQKLPFGIAQMGRAFRNEISPRDFLFRSREFEQMEIEFFLHPEQHLCPLVFDKQFLFNVLLADAQEKDTPMVVLTTQQLLTRKLLSEWHVYWLEQVYQWFLTLGIKPEHLRLREHLKNELAHYSKACFDIEYKFPTGWKEIHGCADRGNFDLTQHQQHSKKSLEVFDETSQKKVLPVVIEPSQGVDRAILAFLFDAYEYSASRGNIVLHLHPTLAPYKIGVYPLVNKLEEGARELFEQLRTVFPSYYDRSGSIGRRYARADEIGVVYGVTVDFDTLTDGTATVRDRETTQQIRVPKNKLQETLSLLLTGKLTFTKAGKLI